MPSTTEQPFTELAAELREQVDAALQHYTALGEGCPDHLQEAIRYSLLAPGKRLRPILVLLAAEACGSTIEMAMPAACAIEMVHAYSLIHDDLPAMDDDDLRRGRPTCHKQFGEAVAILAGDALLTRSFELLARHVRPTDVAVACTAALASAAGATGMVGGQADDLAWEQDSSGERPPSVALLESIHRRKTGALLTAAPVLGGLVAEADDRQMQALKDFGRKLGLAFQIIDDLLDVAGDESATGKRVGKDSTRGKLTYPGLIGVDQSRCLAAETVDAACTALAPLGARSAKLESLARFVLKRNY